MQGNLFHVELADPQDGQLGVGRVGFPGRPGLDEGYITVR